MCGGLWVRLGGEGKAGGGKAERSGALTGVAAMRMQGLRDCTKQFAMCVSHLCGSLTGTGAAQVMGNQILRSATSVAANFREASRARSSREFIARLGLVEQDLDETLLWPELLVESGTMLASRLASLHDEGEQLLKIVVSTIRKTKARTKKTDPA